ncbi:MAG: UbiD family decarboxylase [Bacillota bacterium]
MRYNDLREYIDALEENGLLRRVSEEVDKDWEIAALCRLAFVKVPSENRPALLFEHVKGFRAPVVAGVLGASRRVYAMALGMDEFGENVLTEIAQRWSRAIKNPVTPRLVRTGPCKQNILTGDEIDVFRFPVPMWTVGEDPGLFLTAPCVITKDPESGTRNVGTYRIQLKERNKTGIHMGKTRHIYRHIQKNEAQGKPTPVAIVVGSDPTIGLASVSSIPFGVDELGVAGGLRGEPVDVVKCETVDLEVPATAEIVIEGLIPPGYRELEGPFGEYPGYMGASGDAPVVDVTCITFRDDVIFHAFVSQMPPSESSLIRGCGRESSIFTHLVADHRLPVRDVHLKESGGSAAYLAISMRPQYPGQVWETAWAAWTVDPSLGKITVIVDDDIDIRDPFQLDWAVSFRVQPEKDVHVVRGTAAVMNDPSQAARGVAKEDPSRHISSKMLIDATKKHAYPAIAMPPAEHLRLVAARWAKLGF